MNIIILEAHSKEDGRIRRHIQYLLDNGLSVYHLHYSFLDESLEKGPFTYCGEKGYRIAFNTVSQGKLRNICFLFYSLTQRIMKASIKCLETLQFDPDQPTIIHVHDPLLLPLAVNMRKYNLYDVKIVYDRHEVYENFPKNFGINIFTLYEKITEKFISSIVVVSEDHIRGAARMFPSAKIIAVPNFPSNKDYDMNKINTKITSFTEDSEIIIIYIGGLNRDFDRDVEFLLKIALYVMESRENVKFLIGGPLHEELLKERLHEYSEKFQNRFLFLGIVPRDKAIELTENAHIGFFLIKPDCNYWVKCSPNKVFEYLMCGVIPVIRADIDYYEKINNCSLVFSRTTSDEYILERIYSLISNPKQIQDLMIRTRECGALFTWESVAHKYVDLYNSILA